MNVWCVCIKKGKIIELAIENCNVLVQMIAIKGWPCGMIKMEKSKRKRKKKPSHTVRTHYGLFQTEIAKHLELRLDAVALKWERFHCSNLLLMIHNSSSNKFDRGSWQSINWIVFFFATIFCLFLLFEFVLYGNQFRPFTISSSENYPQLFICVHNTAWCLRWCA